VHVNGDSNGGNIDGLSSGENIGIVMEGRHTYNGGGCCTL